MINALQEQHIQANLNKQWTQRKHVDMICIKVNPPFLNTTERKKSENIKGLIIPKIKCYYNLQLDNNANIKTSFFPPLPPYSYNLYDLYEQPGSYNRQPNFRTTADQIVTEKRVNIEANCGSKEKFLIELRSMQLRGRIAEFNIPIQMFLHKMLKWTEIFRALYIAMKDTIVINVVLIVVFQLNKFKIWEKKLSKKNYQYMVILSP